MFSEKNVKNSIILNLFNIILYIWSLEIKEITQNRISVFNQDLIPNILRTKLIPQLEENEHKAYVAAREFESNKTYDVCVLQN